MKIFILTDERIAAAFEGTNFGDNIKNPSCLVFAQRKRLARHVLKRVVGYHSGSTLNQISLNLGLTTPSGNPTEAGKVFMYNTLIGMLDRVEHSR